MKRLGLAIILALVLVRPALAFDAKGGGGAAGGGTTITSGAGDFTAGTAQSGAVLTGGVSSVQAGATGTSAAAADNSTKLATTLYADRAVGAITRSSTLQQPAMFIGSSATKAIAAAATTGTINTPSGTINGDTEIVFIVLNNTTSTSFVPPAGWAAITSCNASGNTVQGQAFVHTAASEGGTIAAFTWTTNGTGNAWASSFRNVSGVDVCAASTAASSATFTTAGYTAVATSDLNVSVGSNPGVNQFVTYTGPGAPGQLTNFYVYNASQGDALQVSYPITSTTVAGTGFTGQGSAVWVGFQLGLTYSSSTTAGVPGALTYNQFGASLSGLTLVPGYCVNGACYGLFLTGNSTTAQSGIAAIDSQGKVTNLLSASGANGGTGGANLLTIGDATANNGVGTNVVIQKVLQIGTDNSAKTLPRMTMHFDTGHEVAIVANESLGTYKTTTAITIENIELDIKQSPTCTVSDVITCYDCGTSAGACTAGQTNTLATITTATGATRQSVDQTVSTANVAATHYISCIQTAGTCTVLDQAVSMIARPQ